MDSTNIECKILREGGTRAEIDGTEYHFAPLADGAHVAAVTNEAHADRFLSIADSYRLYRGKETPTAKPAPAKPAPKYVTQPEPDTEVQDAAPAPAATPEPEVLLGSSSHPGSFEIHGTAYSLGDIVARAHAYTAMSLADWNALQDDTRAEFIDEELDRINEAGPQTPEESADTALNDAKAQYKAKFGKAPHYRWTAEKIAEELAK